MAYNSPPTATAGGHLATSSQPGGDASNSIEASTAMVEPSSHAWTSDTEGQAPSKQPSGETPASSYQDGPNEATSSSQQPEVGEQEGVSAAEKDTAAPGLSDAGIEQDDDPFQFLKGINRTNSFPVVPPRTNVASSLGPPIQEEVEWEEGTNDGADTTQSRPSASFTEIAPFDGSGSAADFSIHTETDPASSFDFAGLAEVDERYEEGLPLIQSNRQQEERRFAEKQTTEQQLSGDVTHSQVERAKQKPTEDLFPDVEEPPDQGATANLFPGVEEPPNQRATEDLFPFVEPTSMPRSFPPPQRKSTAQVIDSLDTDPRDVQPEPATGINEQSAADDVNAAMGSSATEDVTPSIESQPPQGGDGALDDQALADMWKAALGDDDLLEDPVDTSDTAQLFPSDGPWGEENLWDPSLGSERPPDVISVHSPYALGNSQAPPNGIRAAARGSDGSLGISQPQQPTYQTSPPQPGFSNTYGQPGFSGGIAQTPQGWPTQQQQQPQQRPDLSKAQSFADKAKGGYSSPYDLPADITKPRKRGSAQHAAMYSNQQGSRMAPPPRSTSAFTAPSNEPAMTSTMQYDRPPPSAPASRPQYATMGHAQGGRTATMPAVPAVKSSTSATNFFEDLPVTAGSRRSADGGRGSIGGAATISRAPPRAPPAMPMVGGLPPLPDAVADSMRPPPSESPPLLAAAQLQPPQRMDPFATSSRPSTAPRSTSATSSRYSPAPPAQQAARTREKYAPVPGGPAPSQLPFQPRTSSPLASRSAPQRQGAPPSAESAYAPEIQPPAKQFARPPNEVHTVAPGTIQGSGEPHQDRLRHGLQNEDVYSSSAPVAPVHSWPDRNAPGNVHHQRPMSDSPPPITSHSPVKQRPQAYPARSQYAPSSQMPPSPPQRSQTQSPGAVLPGQPQFTAQRVPYPRPASVDVQTSPKSIKAHPAIASISSNGRSRGMSQPLNYIAPTDGREYDPLSRWRGCPIFSWGFGGTIVTSFPKEVQRYSSGQLFPSLKCSPGEVRTRPAKDILPLDEHTARFPGPLRGKGMREKVVSWVALRMEQLKEQARSYAQMASPEDGKRRDEQTLLLQILRILVEHDGRLAGSDAVQKAVHDALSSHQPSVGDSGANATHSNLHDATRAQPTPSTVDSQSIISIRQALLNGDRESAVWQAVDKRMWAHAMLISSAASPDLWKQVVREFVRNEVRHGGQETESLAALYQIFAGNSEESIDELVPVSARAGLQLISKNVDTRFPKTGFEGLDKWLETLMLVVSNRSADDQRALAALGKLLLDYGRVEAAHVCLLFAGPYAPFGGADEPQSAITLLGQQVRQHTCGDFMDAILLTEVYEFALALASSGSTFAAPHLQAYKYHHALLLAQHGYRNEAQLYCEAIGQTLRSAPKSSGQYYGALVGPLEDLTKRLQRALKDEPSSWISKPSIEKVSDSLFAKFNSFVAGSDNDRTASGANGNQPGTDTGPFARIAGNTPIISRPASQNDVYRPNLPYSGPATLNRSATGLVGSHSRYTPVAGYAPHALPSHGQMGYSGGDLFASSRENLQPNRLPEVDAGSSGYPGPQGYMPHQPSNLGGSQVMSANSDLVNPYAPAPQGAAYPPASYGDSTPSLHGYPYQMATSGQAEMTRPDDNPARGQDDDTPTINGGYDPYTSSYQPPSYEPLSSTDAGYEPPTETSEESAGQNGSASFDEPSRKRSPYMDLDDDETGGRAAELSRQEKLRKDKEAEENFRKAAEADAKRGKQQQGEKKGWLGGWFGGKKEQAPVSGPIKAKLGEESSFYYDTELKKWVNKKGGTQPTRSSATPPPPKSGPPSRAISGSAPPPSTASQGPPAGGPPLSNQTLGRNNTLPLPSGGSGAPPTFSARTPSPAAAGSVHGGGSGPSPSSLQSTQGPTPGQDTNATNNPPPAPPSRPATSMSNASSIDDLLGPATARKGGTMKKAKKGRYVDVMAGGAPTPPPPSA